MAVNLPVLNLPAVIQPPPAPDIQQPNVLNKRVIIVITRDIDESDIMVLKDYGKVLSYDHDIHNNLDCDSFDWAYLIIGSIKYDF